MGDSIKTVMVSTGDYDDVDLQLADEVAKYYADPLGFVLAMFDWGHDDLEGFDGPDVWQVELLKKIGEGVKANNFDGMNPVKPQRHTIASGHGVGKSAMTSWLILWIASTRPNSKGTVTANTSTQLSTKTWAELGKWKRRCLTGHWFEYNAGRGSMSMYNISFPESWRCDAQTCREENSEAFAGQHAVDSSSYYIFDEASTIPDKIWEVAEGGMTDGEPFFFAFGNPTRATGEFRRCFRDPLSNWNTCQVDSRTAKMTNKAQLDEWITKHGLNSDFVRVRILGKFPNASDTQFIPSDVVFSSMQGQIPQNLTDEPLIGAIDLSRGGADDCMIGFRRGKDAKSIPTYTIHGEDSRDSMKVVSKIAMVLDRHKPDITFIDGGGLGGPIIDRLKQLGYNVVEVGFGWTADDSIHYNKKTAEMGDKFRQWLYAGGVLPNNPKLEDQVTCRDFWHNTTNQLCLETKKELKKRLGVSPDWADMLYLQHAQVVPRRRNPDDDAPSSDEKSGDYDPLANMRF